MWAVEANAVATRLPRRSATVLIPVPLRATRASLSPATSRDEGHLMQDVQRRRQSARHRAWSRSPRNRPRRRTRCDVGTGIELVHLMLKSGALFEPLVVLTIRSPLERLVRKADRRFDFVLAGPVDRATRECECGPPARRTGSRRAAGSY